MTAKEKNRVTSWEVGNYVCLLQGVTLSEKALLLCLAVRFNEEAQSAWPSESTLAKYLSRSKRQVIRLVKELLSKKILSCEKSPGRGTVYYFEGLSPKPKKSDETDGMSPVTPVTVGGDTGDMSPVTPVTASGDTGVRAIRNNPKRTLKANPKSEGENQTRKKPPSPSEKRRANHDRRELWIDNLLVLSRLPDTVLMRNAIRAALGAIERDRTVDEAGLWLGLRIWRAIAWGEDDKFNSYWFVEGRYNNSALEFENDNFNYAPPLPWILDDDGRLGIRRSALHHQFPQEAANGT